MVISNQSISLSQTTLFDEKKQGNAEFFYLKILGQGISR
jgi:hypothetical protein